MQNAEVKEALSDMLSAFQDFKKAHDKKFSCVDKRLNELGDVVNALNRGQMEVEASLKTAATGTYGVSPRNAEREAYRTALASYIRSGKFGDISALSVNEDPSGGYTVGPAVSSDITRTLFETSPIRRVARVVSIAPGEGDAFEELLDKDEADALWVGETESRTATKAPDWAKLRIPLHEVYAAPIATQKLLDTSSVDIAGWLIEKLTDKFGRTEAAAFVSGDGAKKPRGFASYPTTTQDDKTRPWGTIQHVSTGASGAYAATNPADALIDLSMSLKSGYRDEAVWLMNRKTAGVTRKLKDGDGTYLWQPSTTAGQPDVLLGFPVLFAEDMPDIATNSLSIAFGNFRRGYTVVDGTQIRLLRDPFTNKPNIVFYAYRRVGGDVANFEAIKLLKFATS